MYGNFRELEDGSKELSYGLSFGKVGEEFYGYNRFWDRIYGVEFPEAFGPDEFDVVNPGVLEKGSGGRDRIVSTRGIIAF